MAKILFIGDPHLKITRFDIAKRFLSWVNEVIHDVSPDLVVNLGDTFDTHAVVRSEILSEFGKHVNFVIERCPYIYVLGNHDMYKPSDSKYHALQTYRSAAHDNKFLVVDETTIIDGITYVPYIHNFKEFPQVETPICVAHQTFVGCDYGYHRPDVGVDADRLNAEIIISGHIHKRQMFGKVIYPGTSFAQSVNDIDQSKGVMLFDTETYKYSFIESPLPSWHGMKCELSQDFSIEDVHNDLFQYVNSGDHWVVDITGPKAEILGYINSEPLAFLREKADIRIRAHYTDKNKEKVRIRASSVEDIFSQYVDKVYSGSLDKGIIKDKALEILNKTQ